jgi:hypothetical protein
MKTPKEGNILDFFFFFFSPLLYNIKFFFFFYKKKSLKKKKNFILYNIQFFLISKCKFIKKQREAPLVCTEYTRSNSLTTDPTKTAHKTTQL